MTSAGVDSPLDSATRARLASQNHWYAFLFFLGSASLAAFLASRSFFFSSASSLARSTAERGANAEG